MELTKEEKEQFLLKRGWHIELGLSVPTLLANDGFEHTFVSSKNMWDALRKGEQKYFSCDPYDRETYDLETAFEYEEETFADELDENNEITEESMYKKIKELIKEDKEE